jgi:hypothetical protein
MPQARIVAGASGAFYVVAGIAGFFATGVSGSGTLAVFPLSPLDNAIHIALGAWGLTAFFAGPTLTRNFCQVVGIILGLLAILGVIMPAGFGVLALGGLDVVVHSASALVLMYSGFAVPRDAVRS